MAASVINGSCSELARALLAIQLTNIKIMNVCQNKTKHGCHIPTPKDSERKRNERNIKARIDCER